MAVKVALLEERTTVRVGMQELLGPHFDVEILDSRDIDAVDRTLARASGADVVIVGQVNESQDLAYVRRLSAFGSNLGFRVIAFWDVSDQSEIALLLSAGACGYVNPSSDSRQIVSAVTIVAGHGMAFVPAPEYRFPPGAALETPPESAGLTSRERMVLSSLSHGLSNAEIAKNLSISEATVKKHLSQAMHKVHQPDRLRAGLYAYRHGLF
ncbi:response regulator transcription factor [Streptomyces sp. NL15-2K]|uniref:response regulator transcription factor n=1 Tax=Streptomyces sp. NL15-2K TaxID=376149 RepID=UPI000F582015|nr:MULTISPECIES: response regulator transcription factor [Actinomycetes]WKX10497.1 response regulator transcription factor [Kutzneria buriramensis]